MGDTFKLTDGMRVYYAAETAGPRDEDGWPTRIPDTSNQSDTGTVRSDGFDHNGRLILTVFWDNSEDPNSPECDDVRADGRLMGVDGWALPLEDDHG